MPPTTWPPSTPRMVLYVRMLYCRKMFPPKFLNCSVTISLSPPNGMFLFRANYTNIVSLQPHLECLRRSRLTNLHLPLAPCAPLAIFRLLPPCEPLVACLPPPPLPPRLLTRQLRFGHAPAPGHLARPDYGYSRQLRLRNGPHPRISPRFPATHASLPCRHSRTPPPTYGTWHPSGTA